MAFSLDILGHAGGFDLLLQLVEFVLLAAAEFLVDGLEFFVEVVLFLRALHLPLDARIDVAVDVQLLEFAVQNFGHAVQAIEHVEVLEQFLLVFHGNLQIGGDGVGKLGRIVDAGRGDHGVVVQVLRELDVLLEKSVDAPNSLIDLRRRLGPHRHQPQGGAIEAFFAGELHDFGALHALHQDANIAVRQLHALHDVGERADGKNLLRLGIVDRGVVLRGQKNLLFAGQRLFQRAHRGFAPDDKRLHHLRENDHIPHRHHRHALHFILFSAKHWS